LRVQNGYQACGVCNGYGHLETDLQPEGPAKFALVIRHGADLRFVVACGPTRLRFGRWGRPFVPVDVRISDDLVAKLHFEICWDESADTHRVRNLSARYLPHVNGTPVGDDGRTLLAGDVISIGNWTLEYVELLAN
jgi:hypothetical protein